MNPFDTAAGLEAHRRLPAGQFFQPLGEFPAEIDTRLSEAEVERRKRRSDASKAYWQARRIADAALTEACERAERKRQENARAHASMKSRAQALGLSIAEFRRWRKEETRTNVALGREAFQDLANAASKAAKRLRRAEARALGISLEQHMSNRRNAARSPR